MNILEILSVLMEVAEKKHLSKPFICGGVPRDKLLNRLDKIDDLDVTTGDEDVHELAREVSQYLKPYGGSYNIFADGHAQIYIDTIKVDFSSNYRAPGIEGLLKSAGMKKPSDMLMELMSRDFTCNALLMTTDLKTILDPTGLGINDLKKKRIRTCLPARMTLANDNKRVVRVLYLAAKLGFDVDDEIIQWVSKNPGSIANVKPKYLADKLQKALNFDKEKTVKLIGEMGLWPHIPILPDLVPYFKESVT
jgi:tRNA nucleotidyltransferase/poly(A) polymerase